MATSIDLQAVAEALQDALSDVQGIRQAYDTIPDQVPVTPAAYVADASVDFGGRFSPTALTADFTITVVVGRYSTSDQSQRTVRRLQSLQPLEDGDDSPHQTIGDALRADPTLNGTCGTCRLVSSDSVSVASIGGVDYVTADFTIRVHN